MKKIESICIITSPFGCIPPHAIGAVEKLWKSCGDYFISKGKKVTFVCKKPDEITNNNSSIYIKGYSRTGSWLKDFALDFIYSLKALQKSPKSDAVILNTIWSPVLLFFFKNKFKVSLYNVARYPKHLFWAYKSVDALSCVSMSVYKEMLKQTPSSEKHACMISNFIDTSIFRPRKKHEYTTNPIIIYSGRVHREKGLDILVKAINEVRKKINITLRIIGAWKTKDGGSGQEYKTELEKYAKGWNIEWIEPIFSPALLAEEMDKGDIYCYPSIADKGETFGVAPLEAMGLGIPTIVSKLECFEDFIKDKENGLVFDHHAKNSVEMLSLCILEIVSDKDTYDKYSENAIKTSRLFSVENKSEEYLLLLNNLYSCKQTGFDRIAKKITRLSDYHE